MRHHMSRSAALLLAIEACSAFYLPGVAPRDYLPGEKVELKVNKLSSTKTQLVRRARAAPLAFRSAPAHTHTYPPIGQ